jgi:hypothetical protein
MRWNKLGWKMQAYVIVGLQILVFFIGLFIHNQFLMGFALGPVALILWVFLDDWLIYKGFK